MERRKRRHRGRPPKHEHLYITDNDTKILMLLARYRYLTPELVTKLLGRQDKQYITNRLRKLLDHKYVTQYYDPRLPLHWPDFYLLDKPGEQELIRRGVMPFQITKLYRQPNGIAAPNFDHDFAICNVLASIEATAIERGVELVTWQEIILRSDGSLKLPFKISHRFPNGSTKQLQDKLVPDGLFGIRRPDGKVSFFALELENNNPIRPTKDLKRASLLRKVLAYQDISKRAVYKDTLGIPNLRVLFVTHSPAHVDTMLQVTESIIGPTNLFLFTHIPIGQPKPFTSLYDRRWSRAGQPETTLI